jgi:hypothetical protein
MVFRLTLELHKIKHSLVDHIQYFCLDYSNIGIGKKLSWENLRRDVYDVMVTILFIQFNAIFWKCQMINNL